MFAVIREIAWYPYRLAEALIEGAVVGWKIATEPPPTEGDDRLGPGCPSVGGHQVVVDLSRVDKIAAAIARNWPDTYAKSWPWSEIPERDREAYRGVARLAVLAAASESTPQ